MIESKDIDYKEVLDTFLNSSIQAQFLIQKDAKILQLNIAAKHFIRKFFNIQKEQIDYNWLDIIHNKDELIEDFNFAFEGNIHMREFVLEDMFHNPVWYEFQYFPVFTKDTMVDQIILTCVEINALKKQHHDLQKTLNINESIFDNNPQCIIVLDKYLNIIYANSSATEMLEIPKESLLRVNVESIFKRIIWEKNYHSIDDLIFEELNAEKAELIITAHKRKYVSIHTRVKIEEEEKKIYVYIDDISSQKNAMITTHFLQESIEESAVGVIILNSLGDILYYNSILLGLCLWCDEIKVNANIIEIGKRYNDEFLNQFMDCIKNKSRWRGKLSSKISDTKTHTFLVTISFLSDTKGKVTRYIAVFREITHEIELEKQLRQAQKLEAIGTLAGGIAHDFNNILTAILGFAELSLFDLEENDPLFSNIKQILGASQRAKDLISQILTFSRQTETQFRPIKLIPIIKESSKLLRASIPVTIDIDKNYLTQRDMIIGDPTQMHQIIMNLCTNAFHAMRDTGGRITITLSQKFLHQIDDNNQNLKQGEYLCLSIEDTGKGIPKSIIEKIFDPYFTTKSVGEGTGLGLSMVHGIVTAMQGFIEVNSTENIGTCFDLYFPSYLESSLEIDQVSEVIKGNGQYILFVDDESAITQIVKQILERLNYQVDCFNDSVYAYDCFIENQEKYDLIMTDMTMPKMTGIDLIQRIRLISKDIPIILCTGYAETLTTESIEKFQINDYMLKPISIQMISQKLNNVFSAKQESEIKE